MSTDKSLLHILGPLLVVIVAVIIGGVLFLNYFPTQSATHLRYLRAITTTAGDSCGKLYNDSLPSIKLMTPMSEMTFKSKNGDSVVYSPYSIDSTMFTVFHGSAGVTQSQFERLYSFPRPNQIITMSHIDSDENEFGSANAMWISRGARIKDEFVDSVKTIDTEIRNLNSNFKQSEEEMNSWASEHTHNLIKKLVPTGSITSSTLMVIGNALYFKGAWKSAFLKKHTFKSDFNVLNWEGGEMVQQVDMMININMNVYVKENEDHRIVVLPYKGEKFQMAFVKLKDNSKGIHRITEILSDPSLLASGLKDFQAKYNTRVQIPKFTVKSSTDLISAYQSLGLTSPFDHTADFSRMMENSVSIGKIQHNIYMRVDEEGTVAAATTAVIMEKMMHGDEIEQFVIDSSFGFVLLHIDGEKSTRLFQGIIRHPK